MTLKSLLDALTTGGKTALVTTGIGCLGLLVYSGLVREQMVYLPYALMAVAVISVFAGGINCGLAASTVGWLHGGLMAVIYVMILAVIRSVVFKIGMVDPGFLVFSVSLLAAGCLGGITGINLRFVRRSRARRRYGL